MFEIIKYKKPLIGYPDWLFTSTEGPLSEDQMPDSEESKCRVVSIEITIEDTAGIEVITYG